MSSINQSPAGSFCYILQIHTYIHTCIHTSCRSCPFMGQQFLLKHLERRHHHSEGPTCHFLWIHPNFHHRHRVRVQHCRCQELREENHERGESIGHECFCGEHHLSHVELLWVVLEPGDKRRQVASGVVYNKRREEITRGGTSLVGCKFIIRGDARCIYKRRSYRYI